MQFLTFDENDFVSLNIVDIYDASFLEIKINGKDLAVALQKATENFYNKPCLVEFEQILDENCNIVSVSHFGLHFLHTENDVDSYNYFYALSKTEISIIFNIYLPRKF